MANFGKENEGPGTCYGVSYNPQTHGVVNCYRGADDTKTELADMTAEQKTACQVFAAAFLILDDDTTTEEDIEIEIDTDMKDKIAAMEPEPAPE